MWAVAIWVGASAAVAQQADADPPADTSLSRYSERTLAGFRVLVHPDGAENDRLHRRVLAALTFDLELIAERVPAPALAVLRESPIVVTPTTPARVGLTGRGMCFHESAVWLTQNGYDAAREGSVEILNMDDFLAWRAEQPMMVLHELAHAYHWRLGVEREDVRAAWRAAKEAGLYASVGYALAEEPRPAYAIGNPREYFAELTEAIFGRNDYAPHTREELRAHDPGGCAVVERLWGMSEVEIAQERRGSEE